ncbi:hypothetical protein HZA43_00310 [Candidatus Peregrinibacteria bacterium]|nr:hypothetical protein [Candidatus Peregrinibacteria bacterium]
MEKHILPDRDELARTGITFVHLWYQPGTRERPPRVATLSCDNPGPKWADEAGVVCYEVVKNEWKPPEVDIIARCRDKLPIIFDGWGHTEHQQYLQ